MRLRCKAGLVFIFLPVIIAYNHTFAANRKHGEWPFHMQSYISRLMKNKKTIQKEAPSRQAFSHGSLSENEIACD